MPPNNVFRSHLNRYLAAVFTLALWQSCAGGQPELELELKEKARAEGLGLVRILNFRIDEITFDPINREQRESFSKYYFNQSRSSPDGRTIVGYYYGPMTGMHNKLTWQDLADTGDAVLLRGVNRSGMEYSEP